ncbi:MAG: hypothetical protein HC831_13635 [Chloroflexia bacterium]|nr:hypothetical protein [Chloroflexia bacterium]
MSVNFYPNLLTYQSTSQLGKMVTQNMVPKGKFYRFNRESSYSLDFYAKRITPEVKISDLDDLQKGTWIFTNKDGYNELKNNKVSFKLLKAFPKFHVTALDLQFLYNKTRKEKLEEEYLVELL